MDLFNTVCTSGQKHLMVIGVDVHHNTTKKTQSVMGFVASLNR